jgi:hypothetical protein
VEKNRRKGGLPEELTKKPCRFAGGHAMGS